MASTTVCIGDGAINVEFGIGDTNSRRLDLLICVQIIATNCHPNTVDFQLVGTHGANKISVGDFAPGRNLVGLDEKILWVPSMAFFASQFFDTPCEQQPSSLASKVRQMLPFVDSQALRILAVWQLGRAVA